MRALARCATKECIECAKNHTQTKRLKRTSTRTRFELVGHFGPDPVGGFFLWWPGVTVVTEPVGRSLIVPRKSVMPGAIKATEKCAKTKTASSERYTHLPR